MTDDQHIREALLAAEDGLADQQPPGPHWVGAVRHGIAAQRRKQRAAATGLASLLVFAGAGTVYAVSGTDRNDNLVAVAPTESATPTAEPTKPPALVVAKQYLEAFSTGIPASMDAMIALAEPGTAAHAFAVHQRMVAAADQAQGLTVKGPGPQSITVSGQLIELCDGPGEDATCAAFAGFKALPNGKLVTFTVDGTPIDTRLLLVADRPVVSAGGVSARVVTAYRSIQTDILEVTLEVRNGTTQAVTIRDGNASYVTARGQQGRFGRFGQTGDSTDLQPGASVPVTVTVPGEDPGGTLTVDVDRASTNEQIGSLRLPVR